jgi:uncharacterized protein (TIGR03118 family)
MNTVGRVCPYSLRFRATGIMILLAALAAIATGQHYKQTNLVSDIPNLAAKTDPNLVNPWGVARSAGSPWWVADNGQGVSTLYDGSGNPFPPPPNGPLVVNIPTPPGGTPPATPTGIVFNGSSDFAVAAGKPAIFVFVTEDGTVSGWNPGVDAHNAILKVNNSPKAVYKGATIGEADGARFLYVANFRRGRIDVFDTNFTRVRLSEEAFEDDELPRGFAPFNVQNIGGNLYVTFAKQDEQKHDEVAGSGLGFVDIFSTRGRLLTHLEHGSWFNAPWGVALAPGDFGEFSHHLLIGNFGSGQIAAFNPVTKRFTGNVRNLDDSVLVIDGLWGISFGNSATAGPYNALFFAAGIQDEQHGLFGMLTPVATEQDGDEP